MFNSEAVDKLIQSGLEDNTFPGAAISVGDKNGEIYRKIYGFRQIVPTTKPMEQDTMFDVASLTKIVPTTMIALRLIQDGKLNLSASLGEFFNAQEDKRGITISHLMTHTSGMPAHVLLQDLVKSPKDAIDYLLGIDLLDAPGKAVVYSCLGFILLGKICETLGGENLSTLAKKWVFDPLGLKTAGYCPDKSNSFAVTEFDHEASVWLEGTVHDENARFLGGVSANAGMFANIQEMATLAMMLANKGSLGDAVIVQKPVFEHAIKNHTTHCPEGRGLGFEVKSTELISCGEVFPVGSYGHTGFTGTSLWVDIETSQYVVFLTNRVHPTRENIQHIPFRRKLHDLCAREYRGLK